MLDCIGEHPIQCILSFGNQKDWSLICIDKNSSLRFFCPMRRFILNFFIYNAIEHHKRPHAHHWSGSSTIIFAYSELFQIYVATQVWITFTSTRINEGRVSVEMSCREIPIGVSTEIACINNQSSCIVSGAQRFGRYSFFEKKMFS